MTPRFSSLEYAISETGQLLRDRLDRHLGREPGGRPSAANGTVLDDEDMLRLLRSVELGFGSE